MVRVVEYQTSRKVYKKYNYSHNESNIMLEQSKNMQRMFSHNEGRSMPERCESVQNVSSYDEGCTKFELLNSIQETSSKKRVA